MRHGVQHVRARQRDRQKYPVCQQLARGNRRKVPGRNCHKECRRAARPTQHRRTPAASSDTRRPACVLRCPRRAHMQVNAHGRRWPNAGRFGLFGAIVNRLREVFWGVERDDLEMILFTLHPL